MSLIKDREYYFEDGNCVIRVQNHLFNLHRTILRKHSSVFSQLFLKPCSNEASGASEVEKDDHPIVCEDSVEAFRSWCWALYAGFQELEGPKRRTAWNEETLGHIGSLAHKYECETIEHWAERMLDSQLQTILCDAKAQIHLSLSSFLGGTQSFPNFPSTKTLGQLLGISHACNWPHVRQNIEKLLLETIQGTWANRGTSESAMELRNVLDIAGNVKDDELKARAYYTFIQSVEWCLCPQERRNRSLGTHFSLSKSVFPGSPKWDSLSALSDAQKICLYRGYLALLSLRSQFKSMPEVNVNCACLKEVEEKWKIHAFKPSDPSFDDPSLFLNMIKHSLDLDRVHTGTGNHEGECGIRQLSKDIDGFLEDIQKNLVHFFTESC